MLSLCVSIDTVKSSLFCFRVNLEDRRFNYVLLDNSTTEIDVPYDSVFGWPISRQTCIVIYAVLNISMIGFIFIRCAVLVSFFMNTSENLHNNMFNALIRSTMYFFNVNSSGINACFEFSRLRIIFCVTNLYYYYYYYFLSGRILNRFTADMGTIDEILLAPIMDFIYVCHNS